MVLNKKFLTRAIKSLNFDKVNLATIIMDGGEKFFQVDEEQIPVTAFSNASQIIEDYKDFIWLIVSYEKSTSDVQKVKKFLMLFDVPEENIVNFGMSSKMTSAWVANLRYVEKRGVDFFATGNKHTRDNLNLKYIPRVHADKNLDKGGVNLAYPSQDLQQSYSIAKYVFEHVEPGTIKFVLIGLTPNSFHYDNSEDFFGFQNLLSFSATKEKMDLNFNSAKKSLNKTFSLKAVADWDDKPKILPEDFVEQNIQILKDYIELCRANGAKPVGIIFPFAPIARENYGAELLESFRRIISQLEEDCDFTCFDMFNGLNLDYNYFYDMTHLNLGGMMSTHSLFSLKLFELNLVPIESFLDMSYDYFSWLSKVAPKENYETFMERIFKASAQRIRSSEKIKVGFVVYDAAQWSGDKLYHLFANDERFEITIFLCLQVLGIDNELVREDFLRGVEQLRTHGLNVVELEDKSDKIPRQNVLIYLTPYLNTLPTSLRLENVTPKTLLAYIPFAFDVAAYSESYFNFEVLLAAWKVFFSSTVAAELYEKNSGIGLPRGTYSGYPRTDIFFDEDAKLDFKWKMARPDAKKIIWAPDWSINDGVRYATFQWNYQFMYEFAKAHQEISWVVKPHQALLFAAVNEKVFPSVEEFKEYLQAWDDLPNAQVYTGAYYQEIFATSDGMIHDNDSFIAEYQFVNKPMIFLTREGDAVNQLGNEILKTAYLVDGKNTKAIAKAIQKVFVKGEDDKSAERKEIFDEQLNYLKANGMTASEFIYKSIADDLQKPSL